MCNSKCRYTKRIRSNFALSVKELFASSRSSVMDFPQPPGLHQSIHSDIIVGFAISDILMIGSS